MPRPGRCRGRSRSSACRDPCRGTARSPPRECTLKIVVVAPMPRASQRMAAPVKAGLRRQHAQRVTRSCRSVSSQRVIGPSPGERSVEGLAQTFARCRADQVCRFRRRRPTGRSRRCSSSVRRMSAARPRRREVGGIERAQRRGEDAHAGGAAAAQDVGAACGWRGRAPRADPAHPPRAAPEPSPSRLADQLRHRRRAHLLGGGEVADRRRAAEDERPTGRRRAPRCRPVDGIGAAQ